MKLILTEAEKKAKIWLELDDESVGKMVKATAFKIKEHDTEDDKIAFWSAALILCGQAAEANADSYTTTMEGLTIHGKSFGTWEITIKKKS